MCISLSVLVCYCSQHKSGPWIARSVEGCPGLSLTQESSWDADCELHLQPGLTAQLFNSIMAGREWCIWFCCCHSMHYSSCCQLLVLGRGKKARALLNQEWHISGGSRFTTKDCVSSAPIGICTVPSVMSLMWAVDAYVRKCMETSGWKTENNSVLWRAVLTKLISMRCKQLSAGH